MILLRKREDCMKATGIVRRIDDLGRVVIPKEIRRTLRIREGDPLEIYTDREGEVILKKYSMIGNLNAFAMEYADSLAQTTGYIVAISDRDTIIAASQGAKKELLHKSISKGLEDAINERKIILASGKDCEYCQVAGESENFAYQMIAPVICEGDAVGAVIIMTKDDKIIFGDTEKKLAVAAAGFLGRQMEQ